MTVSKLKHILIIICAIVMAAVAIDTFFASDVSKANTVVIKRKFRGITEEVNKGQSSYNIYTYEDKDFYKVPADWPGCFLYQNFKSNAKPGDTIFIGIKNDALLRAGSVVSLTLNQVDYLFQDCINTEIKKQKEDMGLIGGIFAIFLVCYYLYYRDHSKNKTAR